MKAWTHGDDDALVRFTAPAKDAGNATLKKADETWVFNPKLNQVIKLPASMLAQSWMGSDFSYNDLSKADDLLTKYTHKLVGHDEDGRSRRLHDRSDSEARRAGGLGQAEVVKVRDDGVMLGETYFDQDMKVVRDMTTDKVGKIGGREYPVIMTMKPADDAREMDPHRDQVRARSISSLPGYLFTLSNLQNPRD